MFHLSVVHACTGFTTDGREFCSREYLIHAGRLPPLTQWRQKPEGWRGASVVFRELELV